MLTLDLGVVGTTDADADLNALPMLLPRLRRVWKDFLRVTSKVCDLATAGIGGSGSGGMGKAVTLWFEK